MLSELQSLLFESQLLYITSIVFIICTIRFTFLPFRELHEPLEDKTFNFTNWNDYRLSDALKGHNIDACKRWPNSLGCMYQQKIQVKFNAQINFDLLLNLTISKANGFEPDGNKCILHLRIGDGLNGEDCFHDEEQCYRNPLNGFKSYSQSKKYFDNLLLDLIKLSCIDTIVIVAVNHIGKFMAKARFPGLNMIEIRRIFEKWNNQYVQDVKEYFLKEGYRIEVRPKMQPDIDFVYMSHSSVFIQSGGGYSALVAEMVKRRGNAVLRYDVCKHEADDLNMLC